MIRPALSVEEITTLGQKFYVEELRDAFEKEYMGQYAVIDVEQKKYQVDPDRLVAIEKARSEFGDKIFYIVQIGNAQHPSVNYSVRRYAWVL